MLFWAWLPLVSILMVITDMIIGHALRHSSLGFFLASMFLGILSFFLLVAGDMGVDYHGYKFFYETMPTFMQFYEGTSLLPLNLEPGFQFIVMTAKSLGLGIRGPVFLLYLLACFILLKGCKTAHIPPLTAAALFVLLIYPDFYGQQRMAFACACGILVLGYLTSGKPFGIIIIALLAAMIQYVALAYFAVLVLHFIDRKNSVYRKFISNRFSLVLGEVRKTFSRDRVSFIFPLTLVISLILLVSSANQTVIIRIVEILELGTLQQVAVVQKFMSYYHRNTLIDLSLLGFSGTTFFILIVIVTYTARPIYWKLRYGLLFLMTSLFSFALLSPLPFVSYRVVEMFYVPGLIYIGSLIVSKKGGMYIGSTALIVLTFVQYANVVSLLGPYSL